MIIKEIQDHAYKTSGRMKAAQKKAAQDAQRQQSHGVSKILSSVGRSGRASTSDKLHNARSFSRTLQYVGRIEDGIQNAELIYSQHLFMLEPEMILAAMETTAAMSERIKNPCKHYVISWAEGEKPTREQMQHACERFLSAAGYGEHQAAAYMHCDNGKYHLHIIANHVHPVTYKAVHRDLRRGRANHKIQERVARQIEIDHKLKQVVGKYYKTVNNRVVVNDDQVKNGQRIGNKAFVAERQSGLPSFERWAKENIQLQADIKEVVSQKTVNWRDIHKLLHNYNLAIKPDKFGKGFVIVDINHPETHHVKASAINRQLSAGFLKKLISADYQQPDNDLSVIRPTTSYNLYIDANKPENPLFIEYCRLHKLTKNMNVDSSKQTLIIKKIEVFENNLTAMINKFADEQKDYESFCSERWKLENQHEKAVQQLLQNINPQFLLDTKHQYHQVTQSALTKLVSGLDSARGSYKSFLQHQPASDEVNQELTRLKSVKPAVVDVLTVGELRKKLRELKDKGGSKSFDASVNLGKLQGLPDSYPAPLLPDGSVDAAVARDYRKTHRPELVKEKARGMTLSL